MGRLFSSPFAHYKREYLKSDAVAALVVTAIAIPESLGYAIVVGLPVQTGLYCALIAPIVFALLASTRRLVIGADSATAALVAAGASTVAVAGSAEYGPAVALLTLMSGILLVVMGVARFGFLADLISKPVLIGFISGVGVQLILTKLPDMFGIHTQGSVIGKLTQLMTGLPSLHIPTLALGVGVIAVILLANRYKLPGTLLGLLVATVLSGVMGLERYGIEMVGVVPSGLPHLVLPTLSVDAMGSMVVAAASIAIVILAQSTATARSYAAKHQEPVDDNRDLIALGGANIASALTGGFAVNGSPPRTAAAESSGGQTQMVNVIMALIVTVVLLCATGLFTVVPHVALSAIILMIGVHLVKMSELKTIWHMHRIEFAIALVSLVCVAILGVRQGVIVAVVISLVERLRREYRPSDAVLLRDGDLNPWIEERLDSSHKYSSRPKGLLIYSFDGAVFFENASYFHQRVMAQVGAAKDPIQRVVIDAGSITDLDYTGADAIKRLYEELSNDDILLVFAHVSPQPEAAV
jgi:SulP family sulfate permease